MLGWAVKALSSALFLSSIVFAIPLAFDIGGRTCGLAFSLSLSVFYFFYSLLRVATPDTSRFRRFLIHSVATIQWLVIPSLLIWSLSKFSIDSNPQGGLDWVSRTFGAKRAADTSIRTWLFGSRGVVESFSIGTWDKLLRWSVPVFQLGEGFCSLLAIQAAGQMTKWAVNRDGGDNWMVSRSISHCSGLAKKDPDRSFSTVCVDSFELCVLSLQSDDVPRARQCRRHSYRSRHYLCYLPLRLGYRKRAWQPGGKLTSCRLFFSTSLTVR